MEIMMIHSTCKLAEKCNKKYCMMYLVSTIMLFYAEWFLPILLS